MSPLLMKGIVAIFVLSCLVGLGNGIICHGCQYATCGDNYNINEYSRNLGDCGDGMYCVKYKTIIWIRNSGEITGNSLESHVVTRSCESKKGQKEGCISWQNNGGVTIKCWCGTDGCNSGRSLRAVLGSVLLFSILGLFVTMFSLHH